MYRKPSNPGGTRGDERTSGPFQPSNGILFAVDEVEAAAAAVEARGTPVVMEREAPVWFLAMINDTEGNTVTFHQRKPQ
jgi:predicted enzyme related to lactoylglutathione lyase